MTWRQHAACRDTDPAVFFPERGEDNAAALAICAGCPVRTECLREALATGDIGIWGGTSERQRIRMRREARAAGQRRWLPDKRCETCHALYTPNSPTQRCCTAACRQRAYWERQRTA